jgi:Cft2 family RNA processing exonuclease
LAGTIVTTILFSCHRKLDCGAHPAYNGLGALPFFDEIDPEEIDLVLITQ